MSSNISKTLWHHTSDHTALYGSLNGKLGSGYGPALTPHGELLQSIIRIYCDRYNNGFGNGPFKSEFKTVSDNIYACLPFISHEDFSNFRSEMHEIDLGAQVLKGNTWSGDVFLEKVAVAIVQAVAVMDQNYTDHYRNISELVDDLKGDSEVDQLRATDFVIKLIRSPDVSIDVMRQVSLAAIEALNPDCLPKPEKKRGPRV